MNSKDFLDPQTLTPESLYVLQSETWAEGARAEREQIIKELTNLVDRFNTSRPSSHWIKDLYRFIERKK
jgi:hypothetical protein